MRKIPCQRCILTPWIILYASMYDSIYDPWPHTSWKCPVLSVNPSFVLVTGHGQTNLSALNFQKTFYDKIYIDQKSPKRKSEMQKAKTKVSAVSSTSAHPTHISLFVNDDNVAQFLDIKFQKHKNTQLEDCLLRILYKNHSQGEKRKKSLRQVKY